MQKMTSDIRKEKIQELEIKANELLKRCQLATLTSINEKGYPRTCVLAIYKNEGFKSIYFVSSKRSHLNGKVTHFENNAKASVCYYLDNDSVTLIGEVEFITNRDIQQEIWNESDRRFFAKGIDDPKFRLIHFQTKEVTFWIAGKFLTCKYK